MCINSALKCNKQKQASQDSSKKKADNYIAIFCQTTKRVIRKIKSAKYLSCMQTARPILLDNYEQYATYTLHCAPMNRVCRKATQITIKIN